MRVFHFSELPYADAWGASDSLRVDFPSRHCDPVRAASLYNRYYDEWMMADELGLDIMTNEHHATATCMAASSAVTLGILARQTRRARLLILGIPIANRPDPIRVAEEIAMVDVVSHGRLEVGLVKGVPYEIAPANLNPVGMMDRFWEAHDLILKALTCQDGPFNWEGDHFHYRQVNIWPRPYQQPHPPIWITALSARSVPTIAERGYVVATMLNGFHAKEVFDVYRKVVRERGQPAPSLDRFAYLALVAVAGSEREARARAEILCGYFRSANLIAEPFKMPPGYLAPKDYAAMLKHGAVRMVPTRDGRRIDPSTASVQDLMDSGLLFCGTPDQVYGQVKEFSTAVGGLGNLLMMGQAGFLNHKDTADNLTLFAREVLPRLQHDSVAAPHALSA